MYTLRYLTFSPSLRYLVASIVPMAGGFRLSTRRLDLNPAIRALSPLISFPTPARFPTEYLHHIQLWLFDLLLPKSPDNWLPLTRLRLIVIF